MTADQWIKKSEIEILSENMFYVMISSVREASYGNQ